MKGYFGFLLLFQFFFCFVGIVSKIRVIETIDYKEVCFVNLNCKAFYIIQTIVHNMLFCTYDAFSYGQKCSK